MVSDEEVVVVAETNGKREMGMERRGREGGGTRGEGSDAEDEAEEGEKEAEEAKSTLHTYVHTYLHRVVYLGFDRLRRRLMQPNQRTAMSLVPGAVDVPIQLTGSTL